MSDEAPVVVDVSPPELARLQNETLNVYFAVVVICIVAIGILVAYVLALGPLVGPGVESSLGYALALLFLLAALLVHVVDRSYREWPLGRRFHPSPPNVVTPARMVYVLRICVVAAVAFAIAYILATLLTS